MIIKSVKKFLTPLPFCVAIVLPGFCASSAVLAAEPSEVVVVGQGNASKWFVSESPHFLAYSDISHDEMAELLDQLEKLDYVLRVFTKTEKSPAASGRQLLYITKDFDDLAFIRTDKPASGIAFFANCSAGAAGFAVKLNHKAISTQDLERKHEQNESYTYLMEAYTRHFLYSNTDIKAPNWFVDGFANYFASTRFVDKKALIGKAPAALMEYLSLLNQGGLGLYNSLSYDDVLLDNDASSHNVGSKEGVKLEYQAKSWMLTHYLLSSSDNLTKFKHYLVQVNQGVAVKDAFKKAFGFESGDLRNKLWAYRHRAAEAVTYRLPGLSDAAVSFSALPKSADDLLLVDAALHACPTEAQGKKILEAARKDSLKHDASDFASQVKSRAEINWGVPSASVNWLSQQVATNKNDDENLVLLGKAKLNMAESSSNSGEQQSLLKDAKMLLLKAYKINPVSAETNYLFFKASLMADAIPSDDALGAGLLAWKYQHEVDEYARVAALVNSYVGNKAEAARILAMLASNSRSGEYAAWAKATLPMIDTMGKAGALQEMRKSIAKPYVFTEWTMASDNIMANVANAAKTGASQTTIDNMKADSNSPLQNRNLSPGNGNQPNMN